MLVMPFHVLASLVAPWSVFYSTATWQNVRVQAATCV
jgi:hypothetical protein